MSVCIKCGDTFAEERYHKKTKCCIECATPACSKCGVEKHLGEFTKDKAECKKCRSKKAKTTYKVRIKKIKEDNSDNKSTLDIDVLIYEISKKIIEEIVIDRSDEEIMTILRTN